MKNKMEKIFIRVRSAKDIVIFSLLIIAGCILAVIPGTDTLNLGGYCLIVIGAALALFLKSGYMNVDTKELYARKEFLFPKEMKVAILTALFSNPNSIELSKNGDSQALKLELFYNKTSGKAYLQLFEYIPYQYEVCSEIYEHEISKVDKLLL